MAHNQEQAHCRNRKTAEEQDHSNGKVNGHHLVFSFRSGSSEAILPMYPGHD